MDFIKQHIISQISKEVNTIDFDRGGYLFLKNPVRGKKHTIIKLNRWSFPYSGQNGHVLAWGVVEGSVAYKVLEEVKKGNYFTIQCHK